MGPGAVVMLVVNDRIAIPEDEIRFEYSRSGGPGGQNVNKVSSKATLRWRPAESQGLREPDRSRILAVLAKKLTVEGELLISSSKTRDQGRNVEDCLDRFRRLLLAAATPPRPRRATRPTLASERRRVESKVRRSETKRSRKPPAAD